MLNLFTIEIQTEIQYANICYSHWNEIELKHIVHLFETLFAHNSKMHFMYDQMANEKLISNYIKYQSM